MIRRLALFLLVATAVVAQNSGYPQSNLTPAYAADTGSVNALVVTLSPCPQSLAATKGLAIVVLPANANTTTTPTLAVCGFTATTITKFGQAALVANDLITTAYAVLIYDGTDYELQNPQTATVGSIANTTAVTANANVTTAQQLMELSLPAAYLNTAKLATVIHSSGIFSVTLTPTVTLTVKLCTVSGCGSGTVVNLAVFTSAATVTASSNQFMLNLSCGTSATGSSGTLICHGGSFVDLTSASVTAAVYTDANTAASSTINLTGALFIDTFVTFSSASASNTMTDQLMYIGTPGGSGATGGGSGAASTLIQLTKTANYTVTSGDFQGTPTTSEEVINFTISSATVVTATLPSTAPGLLSSQMPCVTLQNSAKSYPYELQINTNSLTLDGTAYGANLIGVDPGDGVEICSNGSNYVVGRGKLTTFKTFFGQVGSEQASQVISPTINNIYLTQIEIPQTIVIGHMYIDVATLDAGDLYSWGILSCVSATSCVSGNGSALCSVTATALAATGATSGAISACSQGTVVIPKGQYVVAFTGNAVTAKFFTAGTSFNGFSANNSSTTSSSGAMPSTVALPTAGTTTTPYALPNIQLQ